MKLSQYLLLLISIILSNTACEEQTPATATNTPTKDTIATVDIAPKQDSSLVYLTITTPVLKIRKESNTQSHIVDKIYEGDRCIFLERQHCQTPIDGHLDYWYRIKYKGSEGWVYGAYTSLAQLKKQYSEIDFSLELNAIPVAPLPFNWDAYEYKSKALDVATVAQYLDKAANECDDSWQMGLWTFSAQIAFTKDIYILIYQLLGAGGDVSYLGTFGADGRAISKIEVAQKVDKIGEASDNFQIDGNFNITVQRRVQKEDNKNKNSFELLATEQYSILANGQIQKN